MTLSRVWTVVSTNWLKGQISSQVQKKASRNLRVLDTSFVYDRNADVYNESYKLGHIPQSVHFDLFRCTETTPERLMTVPDVNCFTDYAQSLGVWADTHVVAYDRYGAQAAYKAWWLFRLFGHKNVSVLDGGLKKWLDDGFEVTTEKPEIETSPDWTNKLYFVTLCKEVLEYIYDAL